MDKLPDKRNNRFLAGEIKINPSKYISERKMHIRNVKVLIFEEKINER